MKSILEDETLYIDFFSLCHSFTLHCFDLQKIISHISSSNSARPHLSTYLCRYIHSYLSIVIFSIYLPCHTSNYLQQLDRIYITFCRVNIENMVRGTPNRKHLKVPGSSDGRGLGLERDASHFPSSQSCGKKKTKNSKTLKGKLFLL